MDGRYFGGWAFMDGVREMRGTYVYVSERIFWREVF